MTGNQHAVGLLEQIVERIGHLGLRGEARKQGFGQRNPLDHQRHAVPGAGAGNADHVVVAVEAERLELPIVGQGGTHLNVPAVRDHGGAGRVEQVEEAEQDVHSMCWTTTCRDPAGGLPARRRPLADGLAGRALADAEFGSDLELVGIGSPGLHAPEPMRSTRRSAPWHRAAGLSPSSRWLVRPSPAKGS